MFVMADLASGTTSIGSGWELAVIAGVVVGGVSLFGGAGTMAGGLSGVLLLQVVQSGLVVIGVNANWQQIAVGVIMVLAVGLDILRRRFFIAGAGRRESRPRSKPGSTSRAVNDPARGKPPRAGTVMPGRFATGATGRSCHVHGSQAGRRRRSGRRHIERWPELRRRQGIALGPADA